MEHQRRADLMLLLATSFWGISNCLTAICLRDMQPLTLNAFRFLTAFVVLGFVFRKNVFHASRETVKYSIVVGLSLVVVYTSVTYGVIYTSVSNAGFICALSVVTTPILEFIVYRKKPEKKFGVSMILCLIGLALMTLNETLKPAFGDIICLFAAVFYSVDLMVTEKAVANEKVDPLALGVCDLAVVGVVMLMLSVFLETPALPGTAKVWAAALFLGIVCSGVCLVIQSVYQKHTTASRASLIFTLEPVFSAIFAYFLLNERIGVKGYIGAALMLALCWWRSTWARCLERTRKKRTKSSLPRLVADLQALTGGAFRRSRLYWAHQSKRRPWEKNYRCCADRAVYRRSSSPRSWMSRGRPSANGSAATRRPTSTSCAPSARTSA